MAIATFRVKYQRPKTLSDPYHDFTPDYLNKILATPDNAMDFSHYRNLLGPHLPAGTYDESIYFLPGAFRYLLTDETHATGGLDVVTPIIGFIANNKKYLADDGILDIVRDCIRECLAYWTRQFEVIHYDEKACRKMGWGRKHFDYVKNSEAVCMMTEELVRFEKDADLAEAFVHDLAANSDNPVNAAWFLEYSGSQGAIYPPPAYEPITHIINDEELLLKAALVVEEQVIPKEPSPTYWHDTFMKLGLL
jgi:hypothetical protein